MPSIDVSDQVESAVLRTYGMVWRWCGGRYGVAEIAMMTMNGCFSGLENRSRSSSRTPIHNQCAHRTFIASVARWNYPTQFSLLSFFCKLCIIVINFEDSCNRLLLGFANTTRDSSAATTYKLWCNLNGESEVGESDAVVLNCELEELLDRRSVTKRVTQWKTSEDEQCVIVVYVNDIVTIDSDKFSEILQSPL